MKFQYEVDNHVIEEENIEINFIINFLKQMNTQTSSFCTFSFNDDEYIQCAGSNSKMTIEYREPARIGFLHYVVGVKSFFKTNSKISYTAGIIQVKSNELFNYQHAIEIFTSFIKDRKIPKQYVKRDTTSMFIE
jgi:hypothetical protein